MQGCVMGKQFRQISVRITILKKIPRETAWQVLFGSKIAALNFRKLFNYVKGLGNYTPNPVLA